MKNNWVDALSEADRERWRKVFARRGAEKGGPGSGHFRHPGRPGEVGGSKPTGRAAEPPSERPAAAEGEPEGEPEPAKPKIEPDPATEAAEAAAAKLEVATGLEPSVTDLVTGLTKEHGGKMHGLEFRLKTQESLVRKTLADMIKKQMGAPGSVAQINDVLRYTAVFNPKAYSQSILAIQDAMEEAGWTQFNNKWKNFWHPGGDYSGYHAVFTNAEGFTFEWQFHTPKSIKVRGASHKIYAQVREMPKGPARSRLQKKMHDLWARLKERPRKYEDLPGVAL